MERGSHVAVDRCSNWVASSLIYFWRQQKMIFFIDRLGKLLVVLGEGLIHSILQLAVLLWLLQASHCTQCVHFEGFLWPLCPEFLQRNTKSTTEEVESNLSEFVLWEKLHICKNHRWNQQVSPLDILVSWFYFFCFNFTSIFYCFLTFSVLCLQIQVHLSNLYLAFSGLLLPQSILTQSKEWCTIF